jgi:hypothetical protein
MKIIMITDDSGAKLPPFNKWKNKYGKGINILKNPEILSILKTEKCNFPTDDIKKESFYQEIFREYIRPARYMFAGNFREVTVFGDILSKILPTEIFVISGRYGLISEKSNIIPYNFHVDTEEKLWELDKRTKLLLNIQKLLKREVICIMLLPKCYIQFFLKNNLFQNNLSENLIIVSLAEFEEILKTNENVVFFNRPGVARIGKENREKILNLIKRKL